MTKKLAGRKKSIFVVFFLAIFLSSGVYTALAAKEYTVTEDKGPKVLKPSEKNESVQYYEEGLKLYNSGDYSRAVVYFDRAVRLNPSNEEAKTYKFLAEMNLSRKGMTKSDILELQDRAEFEMNLPNYMQEGVMYFERRDFQNAFQVFQNILEYFPDNAEARNYIEKINIEVENDRRREELMAQSVKLCGEGIALYKNGDYRAAKARLQAAIEIDPMNKEANSYLAKAESKVTELEKQEFKADKVRVILQEAKTLINNSDYEQAAAKADEALRVDPSSSEAKAVRADILNRVKIIEQEEKRRKEEEENAAKAKALFDDGMSLFNGKQYEAAKAKFAAVLKIKASYPEAAEYINQANDRLKQAEEEAIKLEKERIEEEKRIKKEKEEEAKRLKIEKEEEEKRIKKEKEEEAARIAREREEARKKAEEEKARQIKEAALMAKGEALYESGDFKGAVDCMQEALSLNPGNERAKIIIQDSKGLAEKQSESDVYFEQGKALFYNSKFDEALLKFERALEIFPKNRKVFEYISKSNDQITRAKQAKLNYAKAGQLYEDGMQCYMQGDYRNALMMFEESLAIYPGNEKVYAHMMKARHEINKIEDEQLMKQRSREACEEGIKLYSDEKYEKAKEFFEKALSFNPQSVSAQAYLDITNEKLRKLKFEERLDGKKNNKNLTKNILSPENFRDSIDALAMEMENSTDTECLAQGLARIGENKNEMSRFGFNGVSNTDVCVSEIPQAAEDSEKDTAAEDANTEKTDTGTNNTESESTEAAVSEGVFTEQNNTDETGAEEDGFAQEGPAYSEEDNNDLLSEEGQGQAVPSGAGAENSADNIVAANEVQIDTSYGTGMEETGAVQNEPLTVSEPDAAGVRQEPAGVEAKTEETAAPEETGQSEPQISGAEKPAIPEANVQSEKEKKNQLKSLYNNSVKLYNKKKYDEAKAGFNDVLGQDPGDKRASSYINKIDKKLESIEKRSREESAKGAYKDAMNAYKKKKYEDAKAAFEEALKRNPDDKNAAKYLDKTNRELAKISDENKNSDMSKKCLEQGIEFADNNEMYLAKERFEEAVNFNPKNIVAKKRLNEVNKQLAKEAKKEKKKMTKIEDRAYKLLSGIKENEVKVLVSELPGRLQDSRQLNLKQCEDIALKMSLQLKIAENQLKLARNKLWEARRNLGPSLKLKWEESNGKIGGRRYKGRKANFEYNQPIYRGGELIALADQEAVSVQIAENDYKKIRNDILYQVEKAYYNLDKTIKLSGIQKGLHEKVLGISDYVKRSYEAGAIDKIEFLNVSAKTNQINFQYTSALSDIDIAKLILKQAMNTESDFEIEPVQEPLVVKKDINLEECYRVAFANRPDVRINFLMIEYYLYEKKVMKAHGLPKVDFMGSWGYSFEDYIPEDNEEGHYSHKFLPEWYSGIKASLPIEGNTLGYSYVKETWQPQVSSYHGTVSNTSTVTLGILDNLKYYTDMAEADVGLIKSEYEYNKTKQEAMVEVQDSYFKYQKSIMQYDVAKSRLEYQSRQVDFIDLRRQLKEAPASSLIEELIKLGEEQFGMLQAVVDYMISIKALNKSVGVIDYLRLKENAS